MRSWAVPKGPSIDPRVRRLAMEVEDHPMAYNDFEGTIPKGEYGGGTVMLWDQGTYEPDEVEKGETDQQAAVRGYREGKLSITFHGERLHGSFALVRSSSASARSRSGFCERGRVPLIGFVSTRPPRRRRNRSGDEQTTLPSGRSRYAANGAGLISRRRTYACHASPSASASNRCVRFT